MILAKFGNESFYVSSKDGFYTFDGLSFEYGKSIETQGTTGKKPISYITALSLIKSGFKIHLDKRFVDVQGKINAWKTMAESNNLYVFTIGNVMVSQNKFVVQSVKVDNIRINGRGVWLSADLDVSIEEYAGTASVMGILQKRLEDYS